VLPESPPSTALEDPVSHALPAVDLSPDLEIEARDDVEFDGPGDYSCPQPSPQYEPMSPTPGTPEPPPPDWRAMEAFPYFPFHAIAYQGTQTDPVPRTDMGTQTLTEISPLQQALRQVLQERSAHDTT